MTEEKLVLFEKSISRPVLPLFVLIMMAPLSASYPYRTAADEPEITEMLSISSGFISAMPSVPVLPPYIPPKRSPVLALCIGTPSITRSTRS